MLGLPPLDPVGGSAPATPLLDMQEVFRQTVTAIVLIVVIFLPLYKKTAVWFLAIQLFGYSPIILRIRPFSYAYREEVLLLQEPL